MQIESYKPTGLLKNFITSIAYLQGDATGATFQRAYQTIIFNLGTNFHASPLYDRESTPVENTSVIWINGKQDVPIMIENRGTTRMYVLGINGGMLPYLTDLSADKTNNRTTCSTLWGDPALFALREQLLSCSVQTAFALIDSYFTRLLAHKDLADIEKRTWFNKAIHTEAIGSICSTLGVTRKKLREDTLYYYGASAKNLQGMIRFNKTLAAIANDADKPLSAIDNFYDQSHFIKDFRSRTGMVPLQYKRLCQHYPFIKYTPNFIALKKETFLQFISAHTE